MKALQAIPAGSELTISYQPLEAAFMTRRAELKQAYFFDVAPAVHPLGHCLFFAPTCGVASMHECTLGLVHIHVIGIIYLYYIFIYLNHLE